MNDCKIDNKSISIIIPFLNEVEGIAILLQTIEQYYKVRKFDFEIIFVDDGSTDETSTFIKNNPAISFSYKLITLSKNYGSHAAIRAGFLHASHQYATCLPADLQISFDSIEKMYQCILEGYDIVYGVRESVQISRFEKLFSRFYSALMRTYVENNFPSKGIETILINTKTRIVLNNNIEANSSLVLQLLSIGFKNKFIDIHKLNRNAGQSKWTISKKIKLLIDSFVAFSFAPIRLVSFVGILFFMIGIFWTLYIVSRKILFNDVASGWPALTSILLLGFGITNIGLGIIAEYLWRTLDASRKRPVFIIDEIIEFKK